MADTPPLKVFLCHASEDKPIVRELYDRLRADGFDPWLDSEALLPGQDWDLEIQKAMRASEAVIVCFSSVSVSKEGYVQKEIKYAQEIQQEKPEGTIFFIPLLLEECEMPFSLRGIHWGHYYEPDGYEKLVQSLNVRAGQVKAREGTMRSQRHPSAKQKTPQTGSTSSTNIGGNASQSVVVAGNGNTFNVNYGAFPAPGWHRPAAPRPSKAMIGRADEFQTIAAWLKSGRSAAITAAVHGTPGVGKTLLAEHLAAALDGDFPGGVIYEPLGSTFRDPQLATPLLEKWASFGGWIRQENRPPAPEEVRALLSGHGALLVVLDDVWDLDAIQPLRQALPREACLLVTTRKQSIARALGGETYPLDVLSDADALNLLRARLNPAEADLPLLADLAKALGNHALALEIAAASLAPRPRGRWSSAVEEIARRVRAGSGFGNLPLPGEEEGESRVEAALAYSYEDLTPDLRRRFRFLGAFAPDAEFSPAAAAGVWELETPEAAEDLLAAFVERGLATFTPAPISSSKGTPEGGGEKGARARQHTLLRAYALALLRRANEEETARHLHARTYLALMQEANDRQVDYRLLPEYPQLRHAFEWAIEHDLALAQALAGNTADLQAAFSLVRESHSWASQLVEKSKDRDDEAKGAALGTLGNALGRMANLPGEDRRLRLREALAAYEEALRFYRPETAPLGYATTQNNRGAVLRDLADLPGEDRRLRL
ncbi:MAG: TIR domain-containing protein, partial [Chloroflexota bacterium]